MTPSTLRATREIALPLSGLTTFREALRDEAGPVAAVNALHAAGFRSGEDVWRSLTRGDDERIRSISESAFWSGLTDWFARRGWGSLPFEPIHEGVGRLSSPDWAEAEGGEERQPSCAFTTGLLSSVLSSAAGGSVAVLETSCRARGDDVCHWIFGSEATIHRLYGSLLEGRSFEDALRAL